MHIYWDLDNHEFVASLTSTQKITDINLILRDQVPITLHVVRPTSNSGTAYYAEEDVAAGKSAICGIKLGTAAGLAGGYLAYQGTWTKSTTGQYTATLDLNTTELISAMGSTTETEFVLEFTTVDVDGKHYDSSQVTISIKLDLNLGTEAAASSVYVGSNSICREETIAGQKVLILYNSDGVEYARFNPPGA